MKKSALALLGRKIPSFLLFASVIAVSLHDEVSVVDSVAAVVIHTQCGPISVMAKIDTGADGSSVDSTFAERFCITEPYIGNTKINVVPMGRSS